MFVVLEILALALALVLLDFAFLILKLLALDVLLGFLHLLRSLKELRPTERGARSRSDEFSRIPGFTGARTFKATFLDLLSLLEFLGLLFRAFLDLDLFELLELEFLTILDPFLH